MPLHGLKAEGREGIREWKCCYNSISLFGFTCSIFVACGKFLMLVFNVYFIFSESLKVEH
jgi:hypothetical protein